MPIASSTTTPKAGPTTLIARPSPPPLCDIACPDGIFVPPCGCAPIAGRSASIEARNPAANICPIFCEPGFKLEAPCRCVPIESPTTTLKASSTTTPKASPTTLIRPVFPPRCDIQCEDGSVFVPPCGCGPPPCPPGAIEKRDLKTHLCPLGCPPGWTQNHETCKCEGPIAKRAPICPLFCPEDFKLGPGCRCTPILPVC